MDLNKRLHRHLRCPMSTCIPMAISIELHADIRSVLVVMQILSGWLCCSVVCLLWLVREPQSYTLRADQPANGTQLVLTKPGLCVVGVMVWAHAAHLVATIIRWISYSMYVWFFGCTDSHIHVKQLATAVVLLRQILPQMLWHMCCKDFDQWIFKY